MTRRILIVDDDQAMLDFVQDVLTRKGFEPVCFRQAEEALLAIADQDFDAVVTDVRMRGIDGIDLCARISVACSNLPVIVITAFGSMDTAVAALRAGAYDFLTKPLDMDFLILALERAIQHRQLKEEVRRLRDTVQACQRFDELIGGSAPMRKLFDLLGRICQSDASVLITGETGTGKDMVARAIHSQSPRRAARFVAVNCAAMPEQLLESELFGHTRGAFTDARNPRAGLLVHADKGTIFLDEIGDMPLSLQPKLLRALQERTVRPLGSSEEVAVDVRVVAATHQDLEQAVEAGRFRQDLFFRLNVIHLDLPPLRYRGNDLLLLAQRFLEEFSVRAGKKVVGLSPEAARHLLDYPWPGNVRELRNCMERAVTLTSFETISCDVLPPKIQNSPRVSVRPPDPHEDGLISLEEMERRHILLVLDAVQGNKTLAARILGLDRKTLYRKLEIYGQERPSAP